MTNWRRLGSVLFFLFVVYFIAQSGVVVAPTDPGQHNIEWLARSPVPVVCLAPQGQDCAKVYGLWRLPDGTWATLQIPRGLPFQVVMTTPRFCSVVRDVSLAVGPTLTLLRCPDAPASWPYQPVSLDRVHPGEHWYALALEQKEWHWRSLQPVTWMTFRNITLPVFEPFARPVAGSPLLYEKGPSTLGMFLPLSRLHGWTAVWPNPEGNFRVQMPFHLWPELRPPW